MTHELGSVCWFDIPVTSFEDAKRFYGELLGWKFENMGDEYLMIMNGKKTIGGLRKANGPTNQQDSPIVYLAVDKIDPVIKKAKSLGASPVDEKVVISEDDGVYQWFRDRDNNLFALWARS